MTDPINHPSHYNSGKIETWDWMKLGMTDEEFRGYLKGAAMKYIARYKFKGTPSQDLRKAAAYLEKLAEELEEDKAEKREEGEVIEDGCGGSWPPWCPKCGNKSMVVMRPGKVQCMECG